MARVDRTLDAERKTRVLETLAWPREVEHAFFAAHAERLPAPRYEVDRDALNARIASLDALEATLPEGDVIGYWLRGVVASLRDANRLMLALGTTEFYRVSRALYGSARTRFRGDSERNLDLAEHLIERLDDHPGDAARDDDAVPLSADELVQYLTSRAREELPAMSLQIGLDPGITAKVIAGANRVRVRPDARFSVDEAEGLWHHEVETHCLSAQNGAAQSACRFLRSGGPRATRTQEGLAVFAELHHHCLTTARMRRLAERVRLVAMAEDGASFIDLYRYLLGMGAEPREAYFDAQRICRGGRVEGGAPFTKDATYLAGLVDVHAFLAVTVRGGLRDELELLVAGRITLDDLEPLVLLQQLGILTRPRFLPRWIRRWNSLLPDFAFRAFLDEVTLRPVETHFASLLETAGVRPRS